jgi:hypothetical protein
LVNPGEILVVGPHISSGPPTRPTTTWARNAADSGSSTAAIITTSPRWASRSRSSPPDCTPELRCDTPEPQVPNARFADAQPGRLAR